VLTDTLEKKRPLVGDSPVPLSKPIAQPASAPAPTGIPIIPGTPPSGVMPTIAGAAPPNLPKPTPQQSQAAGKQEYQSGMPSITAKPFTSDYYQQEQEKNAYQKEHPWGSDISAHPGTLGKIGHVAGEIGNIAGNALIPNVMARVPGTEMNRAVQEGQNERGFDKAKAQEIQQEPQAGEDALRKAQTGEANARTDALENPQPKPVKEGSPEQQAYDALIAQGMNPEEAYRKVIGDAQTAKPVKPEGAPTTKTMMVNGKPMVMGWNPATSKFDISEGEGQPNYGQQVLPTKTTPVLDSQGVPTTMGWDTKTQRYDIPQGQSASGAFAHEEAQAGAVQRAGESLIKDLQDPAFSKEVGNFPAILQSVFLGTPYANPAQSQIGAEIATYAALQPAMHGMRGQRALEQFEKIIGGIPKNPEALIAAIHGIAKTTGAINPSLNGGGPAPQDASDEVYSSDGKTLLGHVVKGKFVALPKTQ